MTTSATRLTARTPEDLLAAVPLVLGFRPHDSVVLMTFGGPDPFHARLDLPRTRAEVPHVVRALLEPALRHAVHAVVVVVYAEGSRVPGADRVARTLRRRFLASGVQVVQVLRADARCWRVLLPDGDTGPAVPYDVSSHPFTAQAVLEGRALLGSRAELEALLDPDPAEVAAVAGLLPRSVPAGPADAEGAVARHLASGRLPDDVLASVLLGLDDPDVRTAACAALRRADAEVHVRLWTDAVRRAPAEVRAGAAAVLALAAWVSGHGALAWCAVDRCRALEPGNTLARLVAVALEQAVPPTTFESRGA
ncbi:DUF4192 domain-containing protein [Nocardioides dongkuii]|uniref:DUF4192 domain-containing protein n=1 Tax=Nocardioides dongkuii TaxID=2760089 RepID=UPI0015F9C037|nr:DUF4192 domain-containing protein [Nocardioides dongkuii]